VIHLPLAVSKTLAGKLHDFGCVQCGILNAVKLAMVVCILYESQESCTAVVCWSTASYSFRMVDDTLEALHTVLIFWSGSTGMVRQWAK
jgi:hypothetical protein